MSVDNREVFNEILLPYINQDILDIDKLSTILQKIKEKTKGLAIIDFMDGSNWDCFEHFKCDNKKKTIEIIWHDFSTHQEDPICQMVFPTDLHGLFMHFQSFRVIRFQTSMLLLVRGYALEEKDINSYLQPRTQEFKRIEKNAFSEIIYRKVKGQEQLFQVINTHLFSVAILPKGLRISSYVSKKLLYIENANELIKRLNDINTSLAIIDDSSSDSLAEKTNTVRRILENLLKVYSCHLGLTYPKPYSRLMIGELIQGVIENIGADEKKNIEKLTESLNRGSHDSGKPLSKQEIHSYIDSVAQLVYRLLEDATSFTKAGFQQNGHS